MAKDHNFSCCEFCAQRRQTLEPRNQNWWITKTQKPQGVHSLLESMDPRECTKEILIVLRGYKIYARCIYYLSKLYKYTKHIIYIILVVLLPLGHGHL